jgi:hypothetical protein
MGVKKYKLEVLIKVSSPLSFGYVTDSVGNNAPNNPLIVACVFFVRVTQVSRYTYQVSY